ncbi:TspO/MBR family protein, partial [Aphelenchoides avenae]
MKDLLLQRWTLSCWTSDDARNAICTTLASAGIGFLIVTKDPDYAVMLRVSTVRKFLPREITLYQLMDLLAYGSAGYASYLVYKYGG